jgi:ATP-dependent helicase/nuclease subunit B
VLSPLPLETSDKIEDYAYLWGVRGNGWLKEWKMHPRGLETEWLPSDVSALEDLNFAREIIANPLSTLCDSFASARILSEQVEAILRFLEDIDLRSRLDTLANQMAQKGDNRNAQILSQLWEILLTALEQLSAVLGNTTWDSNTFTRLLKLLLSQYDVGTIPTVLDTVMVGSVSSMRCQQVDHLIVLGANEGVFPRYAGTTGVLTDQERKSLRKLGVPLTGSAAEGLQIELSEISSVFCGAEKSIYISSLVDRASSPWKRLQQISQGVFVRENPLGAIATNSV